MPLEVCGSTNAECLSLANDGELDRLWITTKQQTAGKGSRGRNWESITGNLFASLMLRNPCEKQHLGSLTFVAALSALTAIQAAAEDTANTPALELKWPNDVLINRKKCGGILLESISGITGTVLVVGFGINCQNHPETANYPATNLADEGIETSASKVFDLLARQMAEMLLVWDAGKNFTTIRQQWLHFAAGIGQLITVKIPGREDTTGIFTTIDEAGYMLLEKQNGELDRISVADVFFETSNKIDRAGYGKN